MNISTRKTVDNHYMRESFERFAQSEFPHMYLTRKGDTDEYLYKTVHFAWSAWQAANTLSAQNAKPVAFGIFYKGVFQEHAWNFDAANAIAAEDYVGVEDITVEPVYTHPHPAPSQPAQPVMPDELMREMASALRLAVFSDDPLIKSDALAAVTKYNNWKLGIKRPQPPKEDKR